MKKAAAYKPNQYNEYWELIISTLSSFEAKEISSNGKVKKTLVKNDYFFVNDVWNVNDVGEIPQFEEKLEKYKGSHQNLKFQTKNRNIGLELKFVFYHKFFKDDLSFNTLFGSYGRRCLSIFNQFIVEKHSHLHSLLDLELERAEKEWIWWLNNHDIQTTKTVNDIQNGQYEGKSAEVNFLRNIYEDLSSLADTRDEWEKDRWDVRVLNEKYGIPYNKSKSEYYIDFKCIKNEIFREYLKKYIKTRLLSQKKFSWSTAMYNTRYVSIFLNDMSVQEPEWNDLTGLTRKHMAKYLDRLHVHASNIKHKKSNPNQHIFHNVTVINTFLTYTQRYEYVISPKKSISNLIYPEDYPTLGKKTDDNIDYIPDYVLEQLFKNLNDLNPLLQPVVWVAYKTGLRISDVLELTQDCLINLNGKYWIITDIEKTYVKGHKIPIDDQLANIIAVLVHNSKEFSNDDNNPQKYILVRYTGKRKGKPFTQRWVQDNLNELAINKEITDEMGEIFHFKNHQFRHTYAVKMLNGGADILTVQDLLAHASPEMTLRYARLLDDTKRKAFDEASKKGIFSFDLNGKVHEVSKIQEIPEDIIEMMWRDYKLKAIDNPYGTCRAMVDGNCPLAAEPPCLTINNGKPCFDLEVGLNNFDVRKYELHIESTKKMIEASKEYGRQDMVDFNQKNLERYLGIYETIKDGGVIFGNLDRLKRKNQNKPRRGRKGVNHG